MSNEETISKGLRVEQIIKVLEDDYKNMQENGPQHRVTIEFLKGYYACISDIKILAKKT